MRYTNSQSYSILNNVTAHLLSFDVPKMSYKQAKAKIAAHIKAARLHSGMSQNDVARKLNVSQSSYSRMENGIISPDCAQIRVLSGLYNLSILWLLGMPNYLVYANQPSSSSSKP
jgi:DNA-binding XRE family transcriptional regulator